MVQFWRPGDRDYQNLGGTLRSLDRYSGEACALDGVHTATMESPDVTGTSWPAWIQCEVDPLYQELHPSVPEGFNGGNFLSEAKKPFNGGIFLERTFNWYKEARKFCPGVLSASGYFLLNDSEGAVLDSDDFPVERNRPGYQDWYFFGYGKDYLQALRDFEANGYPLSTLVMDMEWHTEGGGGWDFNPELIPDPKRWFELCKKHGLEVTFNNHPQDVREDDFHYAEYVKKAGPEVEIREREYNGKTLKMTMHS